MDVITISREEYNRLSEDSAILSALRAAGVDNWDGWDIAMEIYEEWNKEE